MTDKQIIKLDSLDELYITQLQAQLKAKEQECEELKKRLDCKCFDTKSNNNRCISYNRIAEDYERDLKQLDQLKAEKQGLIKDWEEKKNLAYEIACKNEKLKQTLTEIKEVLQLYNNTTIGTDKGNGIFEFEVSNDNVLGGKLICCYDTNPAKKALQKISEVEDG